MNPADRNLKADLTYWAPGAQNDYSVVTFAAPKRIRGRWQDHVLQITKPNGDEAISRAVAFVDRDVVVGGYLAEGDQTHAADPHLAGAYEIQAFQRTPDLRNLSTERRAYL